MENNFTTYKTKLYPSGIRDELKTRYQFTVIGVDENHIKKLEAFINKIRKEPVMPTKKVAKTKKTKTTKRK